MSTRSFVTVTSFAFAAVAVVFLYIYGWGFLLKPQVEEEPVSYSPEELEVVKKLQDVSVAGREPPVIWRDVDYAEGESTAWYPKGESPLLADLVAAGQLPPVAERVGPEPVVLQGVDGLGEYGGAWRRAAISDSDVTQIRWRLSGSRLIRWSPDGYPLVPHQAKAWEVSEDKTVFTFHLRKGVRWSDGHPLTAEDFQFWWDYIVNRAAKGGQPLPEWMRVEAGYGTLETIDDYTMRFVFPSPNGIFLESLALFNHYDDFPYPAHYLRAYHPDWGDQELIAKTMEAYGIKTAEGLFLRLREPENPEHPRLWPWIPRVYRSSAPFRFSRNPYYYAVDTQGRQLPYIDEIVIDVKNHGLMANTAAAGELSMQTRSLEEKDYTLFMTERQTGDYEVYLWQSDSSNAWVLFPNLDLSVDPTQPETSQKKALLENAKFRQALSLAIDRQQIIDAVFLGDGVPAQVAPVPGSPFYHKALSESFVEYDPERANQLLDELGLVRRDSEGYRTFPDGSRMVWYLSMVNGVEIPSEPYKFVEEDWAEVGIRLIPRFRSRPYFAAEFRASKADFFAWGGSGGILPILDPRMFAAVSPFTHGLYAFGQANWYDKGGLRGERLPGGQAYREPAPDDPLRRTMELHEKARASLSLQEQKAYFREIGDIAAENLWTIGITKGRPHLAVVKNGFRNVPRKGVSSYLFATPANFGLETFYFENAPEDAAAAARIKSGLLEVVPYRASAELSGEGGNASVGGFVRALIWGSVLIGLILIAVRHPFIGRRLLLMIPTMGLISVIVFTIVQLPPGDFVETKVLEAEMTGAENSESIAAELRVLFPADQSWLEKYVRWLGLPWFLSFESVDAGLLQGNLGRSMETRQSVNELVGDRIALTVLVSLGTILFTWSVALPIGIYSAVRQYSVGDYVFSFIGLVGMCFPNFLLSLILMYLSSQYFGINITGLFSPEFSGQAHWDWPKVVDLLKHIWLPVAVLGFGGTASMIRIMRGNLLDELKKPYVTTARAKGVRPFKLLMKYPVRLALNPFISGIGSLFPLLISGGAIVALVMSLPTVGPLMISALLSEDMYLAGSMLLTLSLLGIFGTLVSDLLLLALDPRIRMEGGSR